MQTKLGALDLHRTLLACSVDGLLGWAARFRKNLIQLVLDESAAEPCDGIYVAYIRRELFPLYFLLLRWSGTHLTTPHAFLVRELCICDDDSDLVIYRDYIHPQSCKIK